MPHVLDGIAGYSVAPGSFLDTVNAKGREILNSFAGFPRRGELLFNLQYCNHVIAFHYVCVKFITYTFGVSPV